MKQKLYRGNNPEDGWEFVTVVRDGDGGWAVFVKPQASPDWITAKVCAQQPVPFKANYWLAWSGSRLANGGDFYKLAEHRTDLLAAVRAALLEHECRDLL
jgi:hypothetical protein